MIGFLAKMKLLLKSIQSIFCGFFYRPFHSRGASWVIRTGCALATTSGWLEAKIFKTFQNFGTNSRPPLARSGPDYPSSFATVKWPM